ncbi:MAG: GNAT family N-acetyltransferase [Acidimicrobiia bacterium]|nr:GNAT family N-acetyltransferase [Acidimicrobiia bacterium]
MTTPEVTLRRARPGEAAALAEISRRAFDSDLALGLAPGPGGPPGYASAEWQARMMRAGRYHAVTVDGALAGGAIVFGMGGGHFELGRFFLDPSHHRRGIGKRAMALLFAAYPQAQRWTLDTPTWNHRTRAFYEGHGFVAVGERREPGGPDLVLYERRGQPSAPGAKRPLPPQAGEARGPQARAEGANPNKSAPATSPSA